MTAYVLRDNERVSPELPNGNAAFVWILKHQSMSVEWAMRYEGYAVEIDGVAKNWDQWIADSAQSAGTSPSDVTVPEHSDRARYVTEQVAVWLENDSDHVTAMYQVLTNTKEDKVLAFKQRVIDVILSAKPHSAPWQVRQILAPSDYDRVHWDDVAERVTDVAEAG